MNKDLFDIFVNCKYYPEKNHQVYKEDMNDKSYFFVPYPTVLGMCPCEYLPSSINTSLMNFTRSSLSPIKKVLFRDPATIVFWNDGTKTVVKASNEVYDPEKGLAIAISKKFLGNGGNYYNEFKKWLPTQETEENQ